LVEVADKDKAMAVEAKAKVKDMAVVMDVRQIQVQAKPPSKTMGKKMMMPPSTYLMEKTHMLLTM
jgi:hypothetical protein